MKYLRDGEKPLEKRSAANDMFLEIIAMMDDGELTELLHMVTEEVEARFQCYAELT